MSFEQIGHLVDLYYDKIIMCYLFGEWVDGRLYKVMEPFRFIKRKYERVLAETMGYVASTSLAVTFFYCMKMELEALILIVIVSLCAQAGMIRGFDKATKTLSNGSK